MNAKQINAELNRQGVSAHKLAKQLQVTPSFVNGVIERRCISLPVAVAVAEALRFPVPALFDDVPEYQQLKVVNNG